MTERGGGGSKRLEGWRSPPKDNGGIRNWNPFRREVTHQKWKQPLFPLFFLRLFSRAVCSRNQPIFISAGRRGEGRGERERGNPCPTFPLFFLAAFFSLPPRPLVRRGGSRKKCFPPLLLAEQLLAPRIRESDKTILFPPLPPRPHTIFLARFLSEIHSTVLLPPFSAAPG